MGAVVDDQITGRMDRITPALHGIPYHLEHNHANTREAQSRSRQRQHARWNQEIEKEALTPPRADFDKCQVWPCALTGKEKETKAT